MKTECGQSMPDQATPEESEGKVLVTRMVVSFFVLTIGATSAACQEEEVTSVELPTEHFGTSASRDQVARTTTAEMADAENEPEQDEAQAATMDTPNVGGEENKPTAPEAKGEAGEWLPGELSGEVALVSDYIDRGISNTDHNPAVQGGINYSLGLGFEDISVYAGFWGSNVDFDDGDEATVEIDAMFGLTGAIAGLNWDLGAVYYAYPGANHNLNYDYWEIPLLLSYPVLAGVTVSGSYYYSPNYFGDTGHAHYLKSGIEWELPFKVLTLPLTVAANGGYQWIEDNNRAGYNDYFDWNVGIKTKIKGVYLSAMYTDTSLDKRDCYDGTNLCDARAVLAVGANF